MCILYKWLCLCVLYCISTVVWFLYFKPDLQEDNCIELLAVKHEEFTNEDLELEAQRKHQERQAEEVTEELKSFMAQEIVKGFSLRGPVKFLRHQT